MTPDVVETAAQTLHDRRHRAGTGHVCDGCRADAQAVAEVLLDGEAWARLTGIEQRARAVASAPPGPDPGRHYVRTARHILGDTDA
ncbi:hypothetical protein [Pseudonocardia sp.]|uniref:hypothetical protein n=1 Tax=Pseudonocardia sp. TaxID=60912 RepID=UPI003D09C010